MGDVFKIRLMRWKSVSEGVRKRILTESNCLLWSYRIGMVKKAIGVDDVNGCTNLKEM